MWTKVRRALGPVLPSELASALLAVGIARAYVDVGLPALALFGVVLLTFQYLLGALLLSQERGEELELRARQLAGFQVAVLSAAAAHARPAGPHDRAPQRRGRSLRTRDRGGGRASRRATRSSPTRPGCCTTSASSSSRTSILKGDEKLTEEDWEEIRRHPYEGARIVSEIDGYQPVGEIILAHHERLDGLGYPRGLQGDEIPRDLAHHRPSPTPTT